MKEESIISSVKLGEKSQIRLKAFELADGSFVSFPLTVVRGTKPGKTLYVGAAAHGDEAYASKAAAMVLHKTDPSALSGTLLCISVENPLAFQARLCSTPLDDRDNDLNQAYPGRMEGNLTQRMAYVLYHQLMMNADCAIALHTGGLRFRNVAYTMVGPSHLGKSAEMSFEIAKIFGLDYIQSSAPGHDFPRSMKNVLNNAGKPAFAAELGHCSQSMDGIAEVGVRGVFNVMKHLGMIEGTPELPPKQHLLGERINVRADRGGFPEYSVQLCDQVTKGDEVAKILSPHGEIVQTIYAPLDGIVVAQAYSPIVHSGDRFMIVAAVERAV